MSTNLEIDQPITLLGFDYGLKSIGVAVGQTVTHTAKALTAIKAEKGAPNWRDIETLINAWRPNVLVVGIPLNMDGTEQNITTFAKNFAKELKDRFSLPVCQIDERLTTVEAKAQLFEEKGFRGLSKSAVDAFSAKLILEQYMKQ